MTGNAVTLRGATLRFGQHVIWEDLGLDIVPGECLAILGPNGSGKTTLLKVMLGLLPLSAGTITIDGRAPHRGSAQTGYVPQQREFAPDLPIRGTAASATTKAARSSPPAGHTQRMHPGRRTPAPRPRRPRAPDPPPLTSGRTAGPASGQGGP
jgi:ABC-type Mn2+/Zn2+ transport system ATPase subunit